MAIYNSINLFLIRLLTILVPRALFPPCAMVTAAIFYCLLGRQRRGLTKNLAVVAGPERAGALVRSAFYKFALNWCDIMLMTGLRGERLLNLIGRWASVKPLDDALAAGTGAILISVHLGNWELGGLGLAELGYPINVLTFREPDEKVNQDRARLRRERGINFIYVDRGESSPFAMIEAVSALNRNEVVALLGDRDGSSQTMPFEFFGRTVPIPVGAAYLALATGAPVFPVFLPLDGARYAAIMEEPIFFKASQRDQREAAIREGVERLLALFERYIRAYPDQWYNFFDYFGAGPTRRNDEVADERRPDRPGKAADYRHVPHGGDLKA